LIQTLGLCLSASLKVSVGLGDMAGGVRESLQVYGDGRSATGPLWEDHEILSRSAISIVSSKAALSAEAVCYTMLHSRTYPPQPAREDLVAQSRELQFAYAHLYMFNYHIVA